MFFGLGRKKKLLKENAALKEALTKAEKDSFEAYFLRNTTISTHEGLEIQFKGKEMVQIMADSFWDLVKDSENYVVCSFIKDDHAVEVIVKKKGKLSPQEKLRKLEKILKETVKSLSFCSLHPAIYKEASDYLVQQEKLEKLYKTL